ncbi:hypothetical protein [Pontibacter actiniarum]|uniref:Uncharacterized protein n=1 Tax=Pontibacter actiniarum TaxID=323450 RepID=A0A1X9YZ17_9BACT|nr:hypothetical protein [Pontibacter actiniarum]ARS38145.1 hypothetical protein CA264_21615 [Pontibacter actiniarum]
MTQQENNQQKHQMSQMTDGDLLVPTLNTDPEGGPVYHPAIGKGALWGGLIGGVLVGALAWLVAAGVWPVVGLGQMAGGSYGAAAFMGFVLGSAVGGLIGSFIGINRMFRQYRRHRGMV